MKKFLFMLLLILNISCNQNNELVITENVTHDSNSTLKFNDLIYDCEIIPIKLNDQIFLSENVELCYSNNLFYLIDYEVNNKIIVLNNVGEFQNCIGSKGNGNGEYLNIQDYSINNDTVSIYSNHSDEEYQYLTSGQFLKKNKIQPHFNKVLPMGNGRHFLYIGYDAGEEKNRILEVKDGEIINKFLSSDAKIISYMEYLPTLIPYKEGIIVRETISNVLYFIDKNNVTSILCKFDYKDNNIPENYYTSTNAMEAAIDLMSRDYMSNGRLLINNSFMILQTHLNSADGLGYSYAIKDLYSNKWCWLNYDKNTPLNTFVNDPKFIDNDNNLYFIINKDICNNLISQNKVVNNSSNILSLSNIFILKCKFKI